MAKDRDNVRLRHPNRNTAVEPEELPGILYKGLFEQLAAYHSDCCISVYMPTHRAGMEVNEQQDHITFKTMLQEVRQQLQEKSYPQPAIERMIEPGYKLLREGDTFWYNMTEGLAVFIADNYFKFLRLPFTPKQEMVVNNSFFVSPLIPAMAGREHFYLLVISKKRAKLYRVDEFYMEQMDIPELPNGVDDVVHFEEKNDDGQFSMGAGKPDMKENLALYMKEVDRVLWQKVLGREQAPLLLAGIEYELPIYRSISTYQYIWEDALTGNYENYPTDQLYQAAKEKMTPYFEKQHTMALETYLNKLATPLTTSMPDAVIRSSFYGQVSDLFVEKGAHIWGRFDAQNNELQVHDTQQDGDDCLVDKAAIQTILHGGQVHLLGKDQMPNGSTVAALLRFRV